MMQTDPELLLVFHHISKAVKGLSKACRFLNKMKRQYKDAEREVLGREKILKRAQEDYNELMQERQEEQ
eukprot:3235566-Rhodomonas_salina.2